MKKIISFVIVLMLMLSVFCIAASAEGEGGSTASEVAETVLTRIFEWWEINKTEILAATSGIGALLGYIVVYFKNKKPFTSLLSSAKSSDKKTSDLINAYNELVETFNKQSEEFKYVREELAKLQNSVANTENIESHLAKVLSTVYTNSSALPQGVKDIINVECAECMQIANKDLCGEAVTNDEQDEGESA